MRIVVVMHPLLSQTPSDEIWPALALLWPQISEMIQQARQGKP